jgi:FMN-dependent NADH-azoreductase
MNVLHICANPKPVDESVSKQLAVSFFSTLAANNEDIEVTNIDLYETPPPFFSMDTYRCFWYPETIEGYQATDKEKAAASYTFEQCQLFKQADVLVLTMPLWGASTPAIMKAWLEHVFIPGQTYTIEGTEVKPQHALRKVVLLVSSGAALSENDPNDALTPQMRSSFAFIGVDDVVCAWADGQDPRFHHDYEVRKQLALEAAQELAEEVAELTE